MNIYGPQRKAIYLSPNRLDLLHRCRGISPHIHYTMFAACSQYARRKKRFPSWKSLLLQQLSALLRRAQERILHQHTYRGPVLRREITVRIRVDRDFHI
jgi:hypothetical protein